MIMNSNKKLIIIMTHFQITIVKLEEKIFLPEFKIDKSKKAKKMKIQIKTIKTILIIIRKKLEKKICHIKFAEIAKKV